VRHLLKLAVRLPMSMNASEDGRRSMNRLTSALLRTLQSIKTQITLGSVATLTVAIALTTVMLVRQAEHDTLNAQRYRELREASRTASLLSRRVVDLQRALGATAARLDEGTLSDGAKLAAFLTSQPTLQGLFANIFATSRDGRALVMTEGSALRTVNFNVSDRPYFQRTLSEQRAIVSEPLAGRVTAEPVVVFTYPLIRGGVLYGVLAGTLRLSSQSLLLDLVDDDGSQTLTVVTDIHGRILAHPQSDQLMKPLATESRLAAGFARWSADGSVSEPAGVLIDQPGKVLAAAGVAGPDWIVWLTLDEAELLAPLRAARSQALQWACAMVLVASLMALALITWLLRPLSQLKDRAMHLFDASHDVNSGWPVARGEFGELARVLHHVSAERAQLEGFNALVLAKLGSVLAAAPVGIMFTREGRFELVSAKFCRLFDQAESDFLGQSAARIFASETDYETLDPLVGAAFAAGTTYTGEWKMRRVDGSIFWGRLCGQPVELNRTDAGTIWTLEDVSEQLATRRQLEWSAGHDALTGLANRKTFELRAQTALDALPMSVPSAIVMIDLDRFKPINDTAGHAAGDAMLKAVARAITARVRASDLAARIGGDEFALLLERCPEDAALRIADSVRDAISQAAVAWQGRELKVGASVGVAMLAPETQSVATWLQHADAACYEVKASGRGATLMASHMRRATACEEALSSQIG
jgi:diguanylate cyclase